MKTSLSNGRSLQKKGQRKMNHSLPFQSVITLGTLALISLAPAARAISADSKRRTATARSSMKSPATMPDSMASRTAALAAAPPPSRPEPAFGTASAASVTPRPPPAAEPVTPPGINFSTASLPQPPRRLSLLRPTAKGGAGRLSPTATTSTPAIWAELAPPRLRAASSI